MKVVVIDSDKPTLEAIVRGLLLHLDLKPAVALLSADLETATLVFVTPDSVTTLDRMPAELAAQLRRLLNESEDERERLTPPYERSIYDNPL